MFEKHLLQTQGFRNVVEDGTVIGYEFRMRLSYYRGIALAIIAGLRVRVDGAPVDLDRIRLIVGERHFTLEEAAREERVRWELNQAITVRVLQQGGLAEGTHSVAIEQEIKPAYVPSTIKLVGKAEKTLSILHPDRAPVAGKGPMLGVSLYSYQEEYYTRAMTLDDCLAEVAAIGAQGVQLIAEQMLDGYPSPTPERISQWHAAIAKHGLTPTMMDTFVDTTLGGHRTMSIEEGVDILVQQMELAKTLGFSIIRPTTGPVEDAAPELIARALPHAERLGVCIAPEIHAPIELRGPYIESYLELIGKTGTQFLGFTLDFGIFCTELPKAACDQALRFGAEPALVEYIAYSFAKGVPQEEVMDVVRSRGGSDAAVFLAGIYKVFGPPCNRVEDLDRIVPYLKNVHGKFYVMSEDAEEPTMPYRDIVTALVRAGYTGSIDSEYEGQRMTQDAFETDSCEQVRRHHRLMRKLLAE